MSNKKRISVGSRFYDWQVSANVRVIEVGAIHLYPKCEVAATGAKYIARADALEDPRD